MMLAPAAPDYSTMSVAEVVRHRQRLLDTINAEVSDLNRQFVENPMELDTETIATLFSNLKDINASLEAKKREVETGRARRCCPGTKTTWITIGLEVLAALLLGGAEIANLVITQNVDDQISDLESSCNATLPSGEVDAIKGLSIFKVVVVVFAAGVLVPLVSAIREIDNDRDKAHLLMKVSELKEQGEDIRNFLNTFQQYKHNVRPDSGTEKQEQQKAFSQCVHCLDKLPEKGFREKIPSRDHWISLMVQLLPEDHPIKIQLREMRDAALEAAYPPRVGRSTLASTSSSDDDDDDDTSSGSDSPTPRRKFRGEKMAAPLMIAPLEDRSGSSIRPRHHGFQTRWAMLEHELGFSMNCVQVDDQAINRDGAVKNYISQFQPPPDIYIDGAAASSSSSRRGTTDSVDDMV